MNKIKLALLFIGLSVGIVQRSFAPVYHVRCKADENVTVASRNWPAYTQAEVEELCASKGGAGRVLR